MEEFDITQFEKGNHLSTSCWVTYVHKFYKKDGEYIKFKIFVGTDGTYCSCPMEKTLPLNRYDSFILTLEKVEVLGRESLINRPSSISMTLEDFDLYFNRSVGKLARNSTISLYEKLSFMFEEKKMFCKECGIQLYEEKEFCWACKNGI